MRRFTVLLVTIMLVSQSQSTAQLCRSFGIKVGATFANQYFRYSATMTNSRRIPGFTAAIFAEWFNNPYLSLITQLELTQRGLITDVRTTQGFESWRVAWPDVNNHLHYLSVPVLAKCSVTTSPSIPYLLVGPRVDYLLWYSSDRGYLDGVYKEFKKTILGGSAGTGWNAASVSSVPLTIEVRYNFDFINSSRPYNNIRNDAIDLWLGYAF
jgi:hypothetical protein